MLNDRFRENTTLHLIPLNFLKLPRDNTGISKLAARNSSQTIIHLFYAV